jgi:ferrous iron transport protein A
MRLHELKKHEKGIIQKIEANKALKSRFTSFGITKGETIEVKELTLAKETIEVQVNRTKIALRVSEAKNIEIEKC